MKKKKTCVIIALLCAVLLVGCKSKPAKEVEALISNIGTVSLDSEEAIVKAEEYYATLTEKQKDEVETYKTLVDARTQYDTLVKEKKEAEEVSEFEQKANAMAEMQVKTQSDVDEINRLYEALNDNQRQQLQDPELINRAVELTNYEKAAIGAVQQLRRQLKSKDSLKLANVKVRIGGKGAIAAYYVLVKYSATNGYGGVIDDTTCIDVTDDFASMFWEVTRVMSAFGTGANVSQQDINIYNLYMDKCTDEMTVDCDRIMENIEADLTK